MPSEKARNFTESVIREQTRLIHALHGADGVNLAQGFPDFPCPPELKAAACEAINADINQYAVTWGAPRLRQAIGQKYSAMMGMAIDPETEITVCCGSTEAMLSTMLALVDPGDEVVIIAPFYENYGPDAILTGAVPRYVTLRGPDHHLDLDELRAAFSARTRAIIVNTPHNPTGKVFNRAELEVVAELCREHDAYAFTDEIYEHLVYDGEHVRLATLPGMRERTVTISGASKTYSVTGWRIGYCIAPADLTNAIRKVHDFVSVGAAAPLQEAVAVALALPDSYYETYRNEYRERRDFMVTALQEAGFGCSLPAGAYYVMTDIRGFGLGDDVSFCRHLVEQVGVAAVPGSSFHPAGAMERTQVRFAYPKRMDTLRRGAERLARLRQAASA
ncbi:MAG: pyridoxal phosphate-dependent aminotransferase [Candidatus Dormibacteria bacterium]